MASDGEDRYFDPGVFIGRQRHTHSTAERLEHGLVDLDPCQRRADLGQVVTGQFHVHRAEILLQPVAPREVQVAPQHVGHTAARLGQALSDRAADLELEGVPGSGALGVGEPFEQDVQAHESGVSSARSRRRDVDRHVATQDTTGRGVDDTGGAVLDVAHDLGRPGGVAGLQVRDDLLVLVDRGQPPADGAMVDISTLPTLARNGLASRSAGP